MYKDYTNSLHSFFSQQKSAGKISFTTDVWTDPNQRAFMAVTAHWIEVTEEKSSSGSYKKLQLHADLIGFHKMPGRHTGKHLAYCFKFITDRLNITNRVSTIITSKHYILLITRQIGWITCDNASNNNTMMDELQTMLQRQKIKFNATENRIR